MKNEVIANYEDAIKMMLKQEGVKATNIANHKALDLKLITLEQFRAGARVSPSKYGMVRGISAT